MNKLTLKTIILLVIVTLLTSPSCSQFQDNPTNQETFSVQITDKPMTFCNPLNLSVGSERARRAGEPVVVLYKDDYYLFITGGRGYWYSANMRDWTYVRCSDFSGRLPLSCN